jgi:hypothetical protein
MLVMILRPQGLLTGRIAPRREPPQETREDGPTAIATEAGART